ncbi:MAG: class I SAM-dependent methyltransferase [Gammaproteobacteria bacterium]
MKADIETSAAEIFDTWTIYQKVVAHNNMFHREIYADIAAVLGHKTAGFSLLDLGCGDASNLAPVLAKLPITDYVGVDLSETALDLAQQNLARLNCTVTLQNGDLLHALQKSNETYDVIFSSFALHHLSLEQKAQWFQAAFQCLKQDGLLLLIDIMREENQTLPDYIAMYCRWVQDHWQGLEPLEKDIACQHITENDLPEMFSTLQTLAKLAGFTTCQAVSQYASHRVVYFAY